MTNLSSVTSVGIVAKANLHAAVPHLVELEPWLRARGARVVFERATASLLPPDTARLVADQAALPGQVDMVLVLGGDGTLLATADAIGEAGSGTPILAVNFGSLGFLTEVTLPELRDSLDAALSGRARVEERLMLQATARRAGAVRSRHLVVNDAVITKAALSRMIELSVWVGEEFVATIRADGLIVASPTGSTAYNLAAGGPIVAPTVDALVLTPIAPHTLTNRPVVIPASSVVRIRPAIAERDDVYVTFDGQVGFQLQSGDEISVQRAEAPLRLIKPSTRGYFEVLRAKLKWNER
jgi:NAD+ kinase